MGEREMNNTRFQKPKTIRPSERKEGFEYDGETLHIRECEPTTIQIQCNKIVLQQDEILIDITPQLNYDKNNKKIVLVINGDRYVYKRVVE